LDEIAIINGMLVKSGRTDHANVYVKEGKIAEITRSRSTIPREAKLVDAEGCYVASGFIDVHIHGTGQHSDNYAE